MSKAAQDILGHVETLVGDAGKAPPAAFQPTIDPFLIGLYDSTLSGWYRAEQKELFLGFPISPEDVVLDVGCGDGGNMNLCADIGAHVILADIDANEIAIGKERLSKSNARKLEAYVTDSDPLPLRDGTASRVVCMETLEHVDDPAQIMAELVRVGQKGALYLLTVPDPVAENLQKPLAAPYYWQKPNHLRIFEREEFAKLVTDAGLVIENRYYYGFYWSIWWLLFWQCDVPVDAPYHPVLDNWAQTWKALLDSKNGLRTKRILDRFLPKHQIILARKP
ncbi:class I SAM-dependent methyltransferase [Methylovirgula sp. 4M-Z18]|uniref:class I SAM-dependent methyltransferase n=1 Tax=Methylovirgula sp. 4M-Z18 TaxID=2293567 RepID=UPI000E2EA0F8|nr:class I SAM-dependent methyltransferase [Methylovirgula sp. 4M-Z18]RFB80647.1 class I SAM-dependent methyltransferase [Methylovirgula sp. 4M-Z18]